MKAGFEFIEHTADIKLRMYGERAEHLFVEAVHAFCAYVAKGKRIQKKERKEFSVEGVDMQDLMYSFLDEIIYLLDAEDFIAVDAAVILKDNRIQAIVYGDKASSYNGMSHVKAATYADMYIRQTDKGWEAQVVLDV
ncbi:MAG TPA: archease [Candidatus Nanoarchaeia archaeon]|nr:archease [Candidatus Nanoarchaeia archaeon]